MDNEHDKLNAIFSEALAKASPEERNLYLAEACGPDAELRQAVDSLLAAHERAGDFLHWPIASGGNGGSASEGPGAVIGRYKLLQQIGEGGFGLVFMAEQQEPVRRMVALKIIKAGMDTKEVIARFEAERQALALMDHPNIAHVLDGGTTTSGRPYFVMDLVKGVPITQFCEQHRMSIEERLRLFLKVCAGVQHAHQKGVVHRDLKPTNVLVTLHDGEPVPKVIDFGVAKAIGQKLSEKTLFTRFEQLIGTPAYMSPEQAEWGGVDIDTRSDIYSLGVLLYELLTGTTPFEKETLARAALDEVRRMIREKEPPTPSLRLRGAGEKLVQIAKERHTEPSSLARLVVGDLDWITMRALEKDRSRRYETVNGLARDIERHLNCEPVVACPPSRLYRTRKFVRKHRVGLAVLGGILLALLTGLALALAGFARARRANRKATEEAADAKAINDFLTKDILARASPENSTNREATVREVLDWASANVGESFSNRPLVEAGVEFTLGRAYRWWGEFDVAAEHLQIAAALRAQYLGEDARETLEAQFELARAKFNGGHFHERSLIQLFETSRQKLGPDDPVTIEAEVMIDETVHWLRLMPAPEGFDRKDDLLRALLEKERRIVGPTARETRRTTTLLAARLGDGGQYSAAAAMLEEVLRNERQDPSPLTPVVLRELGRDYFGLGDYTRAVVLLNEGFERYQRRYVPQRHEPMGLAFEFQRLLLIRRELINACGASGLWRRCIELCRPANAPDVLSHDTFYEERGAVAALLAGDQDSFQEITRGLFQSEHGQGPAVPWALAEVYFMQPEGGTNFERAFAVAQGGASTRLGWWERARNTMGMAEYQRGDLTNALRWFQEPLRFGSRPAASQAGYWCAMVHYRQNEMATAKAEMREASRLLNSCLRSGQLGLHWFDYGKALIARAQAERLIFGREVSPRVDAAWLQAARAHWEPVRQRLNRADSLAGEKKWRSARDEYVAAIREPAFDWDAAMAADSEYSSYRPPLPMKMAMTFILAEDEVTYHALCKRFFAAFDRHAGPAAANLALMISLAGSTSTNPIQMQETAKCVRALEQSPGYFWWDIVRAMEEYRAGQYETLAGSPGLSPNVQPPPVIMVPQIFRAMALAKLGRTLEGKEVLEDVESRIAPDLEAFTHSPWWELALCQVALDEANQLFHKENEPKGFQK